MKTFSMGGIGLDKQKLSANIKIEDAEVPEFVFIPVKQHIGAPAKILKKKGDKVKVGTLLADADGIISSDIHSSVSGEIVKIEETECETGYLETMITIKTEGDEWEEIIDRSLDIIKEIPYTPEEIVQKIRNCGIVGMGGAGYPTPIKTTLPEGKKAEYLILNGIECEPYLTADDRLMVECAEQIIIGAKIINKALGIQNAIIAIDENKKHAIEILTELSKRYIGVNVEVLKSKYPQGAERQLIQAIIGKEVPSGRLPIDVGCIVQNVGTAFAIYEGVMKNKPLFERIVTVSGNQAVRKANFKVRVGTPAFFITEKCIDNISEVDEIIFGGPMMGLSAVNLNAPITKTTSGILLLNQNISAESACIRCSKCVENCPAGLLPYLIAEKTRNFEYKELKALSALDCIECGCCSYGCPAKIPLLDYCKLAKSELRK